MIQKNWQELIKPTNLDVTSEGGKKAKIVVEPLERGFGLTLGNALRRVLLSSLQGGAVTAIKINGVLHERAGKGENHCRDTVRYDRFLPKICR